MSNPNAIHTDLVNNTQSIIQGLGLFYGSTALPNSQVYAFKKPSNRKVTKPCIQACLGGKEEMDKGDFEDTVIIFPVLVVTMFQSDTNLLINNDELYWRQQIIIKFIDQPRPEVTSADIADCHIDPDPVLDEDIFKEANLDVSGLMLLFRASILRNRS